LNLELKLRKNNLLPKLDLKFQYLSNTMQASNQSYRMGLSFSTPLFMMQSRAELKEFQQKKRDSELQLELKKREITAKRNSILQQIQLSNSLFQTQKGIERNMKLLMDFEFTKFQLGESSIFILNNRESRLWESKIKTKDVQNKLLINYIDYLRLNGEILKFFAVH
jgi:outer membrane protein TolC